ncbi:hypothetical protein ARMGADRAFT_519382 [Armillaria gallica]|uniref:RING-type domain-containing protein n=1 Tax=Armillaria gallica TaxID=47427 RepID=A0A2H3EI10_ARMGA|nr:hypothetical protein ARMGADRAFT_519382 [Armillaria gallica]
MVQSCVICFSPYNNPVSTPCGHIFCQACISEYILACNNGLSSSCPTCRAEFPIGTPDLKHLPRSFHPFIFPGIRRVFLDTSPSPEIEKLKHELKAVKESMALEKKYSSMTNWKPRTNKAKSFVTPLLKWCAPKDKYTKFKKAFDGTLSLVTSGVKHRSSGNLDDNHHSASGGCHEPARRSLKDLSLPQSTVHFRDIRTPAEEVIWIHMPSFLSFLLLCTLLALCCYAMGL